MDGTVAVTDFDWYTFLLAAEPAEVNFWAPSDRRRLVAPHFSPFFFKLKAPYRAICGFGYFARWTSLPDWLAWECFGVGNGAASLEALRARIGDIRRRTAAGADIDGRDVDHRATPAQWMLAERRGTGRYDLARYLVDKGALVDIFLAAALGLADRALALIRATPATLDLRTGQGEYGEQPPSSYHIYFWTIGAGRSPLDVAEQFDQADTLQAMLAVASPLQRLLFACSHADEEAAGSLMRENPRLVESMLPEQHRALADAAWRGDVRAVALMLSLGFDPRTPGHDSGSALHLAAWDGSVDMVETLLRDPVARELVATRDAHHGGTPLGWCCYGSAHGADHGDHATVARLLLDAGAEPGGDGQDASPAVQAVLRGARSGEQR